MAAVKPLRNGANEIDLQTFYRQLVSDNHALAETVLKSAEAWLKVKVGKQPQKRGQPPPTLAARCEQDAAVGMPTAAPPGLARLVRRLKAERDFLQQVLSSAEPISDSHAMSSNLAHLHALFVTACHIRDCTAVLRRVAFRRPPNTYDDLFIALSDVDDESASRCSSDDDDNDDNMATKSVGVAINHSQSADRSSDTELGQRHPDPAASSSDAATSSGSRPQAQAAARVDRNTPMSETELEQYLQQRLKQDLGLDDDDGEDSGDDGDDFSDSSGSFSFGDGGDDDQDLGSEDDEVDAEGEEDTLVVDVVGNGGSTWIKVVARNPMSLHRACQGSSFGHRSILSQAQDLLFAATQNRKDFAAPRVVVVFVKGITQAVADKLRSMKVVVSGSICSSREPGAVFNERDALLAQLQRIPATTAATDSASSQTLSPTEQAESALSPCALAAAKMEVALVATINELSTTLGSNDAHLADVQCVNLDVSTMLVLCSELTHGHANYVFKSAVLNEQAARERKEPALPPLEEFLRGKELVCCQTAITEFTDIVSTVAGRTEKARAAELRTRVRVIDDKPSPRVSVLKESGKIRARAKVIFGTGESMQLITTTANMAFVRAASGQGINFSMFRHESRALTESKQAHATPLPVDGDSDGQGLAS